MFEKLLDRFLEKTGQYIGLRNWAVLCGIAFVGWAASLLIAHQIKTGELLGFCLSLLLGFSYAWAIYRKRLRAVFQWLSLGLLIFLSVALMYRIAGFRSAKQNQLDRVMIEAQESGVTDYAAGKWKEAYSLAVNLNDHQARQQCACQLGQVQAALGNQPMQARASLQLCLTLSKGTFAAEAMANVALGQFEAVQWRSDSARQHFLDAIEILRKVPHSEIFQAKAHVALGNLAKNTQQVMEAYIDYKKALDLYKMHGDSPESREGQAGVRIGMGELELIQGRIAEARSDYSIAFAVFNALGERAGEADALVGLGDVARALGNENEARQSYGQASGLFGQDSLGQAAVKFGLGELELQLGKREVALRDLTEALNLYDKNDKLDRSNVYVQLITLERMSGYFDQARKYLEKAMPDAPSDSRLVNANLLYAGAELARDDLDFPLAKQEYADSYEIYKSLAAPVGMANVRLGQGRLEMESKSYEAARMDYDEAGEIYETQEIGVGVAGVLLAQGDLERKRKHYEKAPSLYLAALAKYGGEDRTGEAKDWLSLGDLEHEIGRNEEAHTDYEKARGLFEEQHNQIGEANVALADGKALAALRPPKFRNQALERFADAQSLYAKLGIRKKFEEARNEKRNLLQKLGGRDEADSTVPDIP
jgi:tetratricopeptide (TPR) repeat protein